MNDHRDSSREASTPGIAQTNPAPDGKGLHWSDWLVWCSVFLLAVVLGRNGWEAYQQQQRIHAVRCDEPVFDFGQAFIGDAIEHTFHVSNVGPVPLTIEKVMASCGCTTVATQLEGVSVAPNQSFSIPVELSLTGLEEGVFDRSVVVKFAGALQVPLTLTLKGRVNPVWTWSKETVVFDGIPRDKVSSRTIELRRSADAPVNELPEIILSSTKQLRADIEDATPPEGGLIRKVTLTTIPPLQPGRQEVTLHTSIAGSSTTIAPVRIVLVVVE